MGSGSKVKEHHRVVIIIMLAMPVDGMVVLVKPSMTYPITLTPSTEIIQVRFNLSSRIKILQRKIVSKCLMSFAWERRKEV
jgi:hypothetical protein